jgi:hypothetical protein
LLSINRNKYSKQEHLSIEHHLHLETSVCCSLAWLFFFYKAGSLIKYCTLICCYLLISIHSHLSLWCVLSLRCTYAYTLLSAHFSLSWLIRSLFLGDSNCIKGERLIKIKAFVTTITLLLLQSDRYNCWHIRESQTIQSTLIIHENICWKSILDGDDNQLVDKVLFSNLIRFI